MKRIPELILVGLSAFLLLAVLTFAAPCALGETVMTCHWAGRTIAGLAFVMLLQALLALVLRERSGFLAMVPVAVLTAWMPGHGIGLCLMDGMRCRSVMQPTVLILSILIAGYALILGLWKRR